LAISQQALGSLIMAAPSAVFTIAYVAEMLGEDVDWLADAALEMEPEDGRLAVYEVDDQETTAFTNSGIENLKELIKIHKANPSIIERYRKFG
jgi:hypothetical protein